MKRVYSTALAGALSLSLALPAIAEDFWLKDAETGCEIWSDEPANEDDVITWSGECDESNKATGSGLAVWIRGNEVYSRYTGSMRGGRLDGEDGLLLVRSEGADGYDVVYGSFSEGALHGEVTVLGADGTLFQGGYVDGVREGPGLIVDSKGNSFQGEFVAGSAEGIGHSFSASGEAYVGEFSNNKWNGLGVLYEENGQIFVGEFEDDVASGPGRLEGPDGYFQGRFSGDAPNGHGVLVAKDGTTRQGLFIDGEPDGLILVTKPDGDQTTETWANGEQVK